MLYAKGLFTRSRLRQENLTGEIPGGRRGRSARSRGGSHHGSDRVTFRHSHLGRRAGGERSAHDPAPNHGAKKPSGFFVIATETM